MKILQSCHFNVHKAMNLGIFANIKRSFFYIFFYKSTSIVFNIYPENILVDKTVTIKITCVVISLHYVILWLENSKELFNIFYLRGHRLLRKASLSHKNFCCFWNLEKVCGLKLLPMTNLEKSRQYKLSVKNRKTAKVSVSESFFL